MRVVALQRFEYANKLRLPLDVFDTDSDEDARLLILVGRVAEILFPDPPVTFPGEPGFPGPPYKTRDLKSGASAPDKRNRYRHRAMRADE